MLASEDNAESLLPSRKRLPPFPSANSGGPLSRPESSLGVAEYPAGEIPQELVLREVAGDLPVPPPPAAERPPVFSPLERLRACAEMPIPWRRPLGFLWWSVRSVFGLATIVLILAVLATIPVVNLLVLGYFLEVEGRVARSGRLREAFPLIGIAPRLGTASLGIILSLIPVQVLAWVAGDAQLISPGSATAKTLNVAVFVVALLTTAHICLALSRGGTLWNFAWPFPGLWSFSRNCLSESYWENIDQNLREVWRELRVKHHFLLGLRGLIGTFAWLFLPTLLFAASRKPEGVAVIVTLLGGILLVFVLTIVPYLQVRFAAENRMSAFWEWKAIRELYRRAPLSLALGTFVMCLLSLPLFFGTVVLAPQDGRWLVTPFFILSIFPVKIALGWAYAQAAKRTQRTWFSLRLLCSSVLMPSVLVYVFVLFFTQFIGSSGKLVLFQHHALLLPLPY